MSKDCVTAVYSRVTGYFGVVSGWNKGKREEFKDRKTYSVKEKDKEIKDK